MIVYKTEEEINIMKRAGKVLHEALKYATDILEPGMTTEFLNDQVEKFIIQHGGEPGFKKVSGYSWGTCICINEQVVHTPPSKRIIKEGDVVTIDSGVYMQGFHTDSATTVEVGIQTLDVQRFLDVGKKALKGALEQAKAGKHIGNISYVFQTEIQNAGYSIIPELTGHGVGRDLHEDPYVPCFLDRPIEKTIVLKPGMTLAIEVMYAMGEPKLVHEKDGWSLKVADNSITGMFEHTVAIAEKSTLILT